MGGKDFFEEVICNVVVLYFAVKKKFIKIKRVSIDIVICFSYSFATSIDIDSVYVDINIKYISCLKLEEQNIFS